MMLHVKLGSNSCWVLGEIALTGDIRLFARDFIEPQMRDSLNLLIAVLAEVPAKIAIDSRRVKTLFVCLS